MSNQVKLALLFILLVPCWVIAVHGVGDIGMYYAVAGYAKHLEFEKIYGINAGVGHFFYGPLSLVSFGWMPWFTYEQVRWIWILINTVAYVAFWWGLHQLYPFLKDRRTSWLWFFVWVTSIKAIHASFQSHNVQLVIAACLVCGEYWRRDKRAWVRFMSGWPTALAGVVKVFPLFVSLFTFLRGDRKVRIGIMTAGVVGVALPFAYFGFKPALNLYQVFVGNLGSFHDYAPLTKDAVTLSLASFVATWFSPWIGMSGASLVTTVVSAILVIWFLFVIKRDGIHYFSLGLALMALVNSTTRPDYFIFFVPAFASLAQIWHERRPSVWFVVGVGSSLFLIDLIAEWTLGSRELGHQLELYRLPVIGMMILCLTLCLATRTSLTHKAAS